MRTCLLIGLILLIFSCGNKNKIEIKGDENALILAEKMITALGGKKTWSELKSVHIKTNYYGATSDLNVSEIWANVDEKKIFFIQIYDDVQKIKVINGNDGWEIKDGRMEILATNELFPVLRWYQYNFYKNVKRLSAGGPDYELKSNGEKRFDIYEKGEYVGGYELGEDNLPIRFYSPGIYSGVEENMIKFKNWDTYGSYTFPKLITGETAITSNETEIFEGSNKPAEKAFSITFNPVELAEKY